MFLFSVLWSVLGFSSGANDYLERLVSEMTCYGSSGT